MAEKIKILDAKPLSLQDTIVAAREFLRQGKTVAESEIAYVGQGIGVIRNLKRACFDDRKVGASLKKEAHTQIEQLIRRLSDVDVDLTDGRGRKYSNILAHYRASELSDDKTLAQEFENCRAEYLKNPANGETCNRYGWMLHDCLKAAYDRLQNAKLTEFFKKEFEAWHYQGTEKLHDANLEKCRERDIKCADAFLNGPREALILLSSGEWAKAKKSADAYLVSNPGNAAALEVVLKACEKSTGFDDVVAMVNAASTAIKWHPDELSFQHWFVKAIGKMLGAIFAQVPNANPAQRVLLASAGCGELVRQCCTHFPLLSLLGPGTSDYSRILFVVVAASESIFAQRMMLKGLLAELAPKVVAFVRAWGLNNFRATDKDEPAGGRRRYSLAGRTVLMLLKYCEYGVPKEDIEWTLHITEELQYLFKRDLTGFLNAAASLYHTYGNEGESRRFAIDLVRCNQAEGWRWTVLARTYPKGSQERADCFAYAQSRQKDGDDLDELIKDSPIDNFSVKKSENAEDGDSIKFRTALTRAEALLQGETSKIAGVVLTRFKDKVLQSDMLRVWWRDPKDDLAHSDFVSFAGVAGLETVVAGAPVTLSVVEIGDRRKVVGIVPRPEGAPWDIYPYGDAIVVARNDVRHFVKIMYGVGRSCSADPRKNVALSRLQVGDFCQVAVWEREGQPSVALAVKMVDGFHPCLAFCREYNGVLRRVKGSRNGVVGEIVVTPEARGEVYFETSVAGLAVMLGGVNEPRWHAVTCKPFRDLEVLQ